jgi:hypothetical protein
LRVPAALLQAPCHLNTTMETCASSIARELWPDGNEKMSGPTNSPPCTHSRST